MFDDDVSPVLTPVPFDKIFMDADTQEQVKEFLRYLKSPQQDEGEEEEDQVYQPNEREESEIYELHQSEGQRFTSGQVVSQFDVGKLCRYGFEGERSEQACSGPAEGNLEPRWKSSPSRFTLINTVRELSVSMVCKRLQWMNVRSRGRKKRWCCQPFMGSASVSNHLQMQSGR